MCNLPTSPSYIERFGDLRGPLGEPLLLIDVDALPRWVAEYNVKPAPREDLWKGQVPVKEVVLRCEVARCFHGERRWPPLTVTYLSPELIRRRRVNERTKLLRPY